MKVLAHPSRVNTNLQVIQHMNDGLIVVDACQEIDIRGEANARILCIASNSQWFFTNSQKM